MRARGSRVRIRDDDAALLSRTRAGDEQAFAAIFKRHHAPLLSYCWHTLGNRDEGEDALQQAFIKAHQALLGGTEPRELRPWLYAIARNCCLSAIAARRPTAPLEDHTPALAGLSDEVRGREDLRDLLAAIGHLPEDQRSALLLAELDDLSHEAIAKVVGCPVSKVKALVYQARSALIADRDARETPCGDIREQLSSARGGELRRAPLRRHLKLCAGCRDFQLAVNAQRQSLAALLPVLPSAGLAASILGHGASHAMGATSIGAAGGAAPAGGAAGTGVGTTAAATATGGGGIAASGTAATASTAAAAGAGGGTSVGALVGGGLITKLAVGGTVVALAAAGAVAVHPRPARAISTPRRASFSPVAGPRIASFATRQSDAAGVLVANDDGPYGAPGSGSPVALTGAGGAAGYTGSDPLTESTSGSGGGAQPLLALIGANPPSPALQGPPEASTVKARASSDGQGSPATSPKSCAEPRCAKLGPRALRLHEARRRALLRKTLREARRRARLRRALRKARRRAHPRKALPRAPRHRPAPLRPKPPSSSTPTPPLAPAPTPVRHRKARPTSPPLASPTGSQTGSDSEASKETAVQHRRSAASTSAGSTTAKGTDRETSTTSTGGGKGKAGSGAGAEKAGSGAGTGGPAKSKSGAGAEKSSSGAGGKESGSGTRTGKSDPETGAGSASAGGTGDATESGDTASHTGETTGATATDTTSHAGTTPHPQKQRLVEEAQLPNL
jgi:RNA polymerase sigma factor (sigma-70 family)